MNIITPDHINGTAWSDLPIKEWAVLGSHVEAFVYMVKRWTVPHIWEPTMLFDYLLVFKTNHGWTAQREQPEFKLTKIDYEFATKEDAANAALGLIQ